MGNLLTISSRGLSSCLLEQPVQSKWAKNSWFLISSILLQPSLSWGFTLSRELMRLDSGLETGFLASTQQPSLLLQLLTKLGHSIWAAEYGIMLQVMKQSRMPRAHRSMALSTHFRKCTSGPIDVIVPCKSSTRILSLSETSQKSESKGQPLESIRTLSVFRSQQMSPRVCRYSSPKTMPAITNLMPVSSRLLKASPFPLHFSRKDVKSPPSATCMPEYKYFQQTNVNRALIKKGLSFSWSNFLESSSASMLNFCFLRFVLFTAIFSSSLSANCQSMVVFLITIQKTLDWPPLPSYETTSISSIFSLATALLLELSVFKNCNNLCECFFIESTEFSLLAVVELEDVLTFFRILQAGSSLTSQTQQQFPILRKYIYYILYYNLRPFQLYPRLMGPQFGGFGTWEGVFLFSNTFLWLQLGHKYKRIIGNGLNRRQMKQ